MKQKYLLDECINYYSSNGSGISVIEMPVLADNSFVWLLPISQTSTRFLSNSFILSGVNFKYISPKCNLLYVILILTGKIFDVTG